MMYDPELSRLITMAISRTNAELKQAAPYMASQVARWQRQLSDANQLEDYFKNPHSFPILLLPWWLEQTLHQPPDFAFQFDLVRSTINGYYYIRFIDNLMDGHPTVELKLLPVLGFFYTQFLTTYQRHFPQDHPFWNVFTTISFQSAEITMKDANLTDIDWVQFRQVSAKKMSGIKIPIAAVCYKYGQPDLMAPWAELVDVLGCWHQMLNDLFDWSKDLKHQTPTFFLSEAQRRRRSTESVLYWVMKEGFDWAVECILTWMDESKLLARKLNSSHLMVYLDRREALFLRQKEEVAVGFQNGVKLLELLQ